LTITSGKNYDVFLYDNAGTLTLELSAAWTSDTARADALTTQDGVYVKSGATTRRHLGTIRASGANITEESTSKRFVVNRYNQVQRLLLIAPGYNNDNAVSSYSTSSATYVEANGGTGSRCEFLAMTGQPIIMSATFMMVALAGCQGRGGLGVDTVAGPEATAFLDAPASQAGCGPGQGYVFQLVDGYHYLSMLICRAAGASAITFYADLQRDGAAADPYSTYARGWVMG